MNNCIKCNETCVDCLADDINKCTSCYEGYLYQSNSQICKICSDLIQNCKNSAFYLGVTTCTECEEDKFLNEEQNECQSCQSLFKNCKECTQINSIATCTSCEQNYTLSNNQCISCNLTNCLKCGNTLIQCLQCEDEFFINQNQSCESCQQIDKNCNKCQDQIDCEQCSFPYKLTENQCLLNCSSYQQDSNQDFICENCTKSILFCDECTEKGDQCLKCKSNFINKVNECAKCSDEIKNCATCDDSKCIQCNHNFLLLEGKCVSSCSDESYVQINQECKKCDQIFYNCEKCGIEECKQCKEGYKLENNICNANSNNSNNQDQTEELQEYNQAPTSLKEFNLSQTEQVIYQSASAASDAVLYVGVACSSILTVILGSSGGSFAGWFTLLLASQLILINAFVNVHKPLNLAAYYFQQSESKMIASGNDNKFLMFNLDAEEMRVKEKNLLIIGYQSYTLLANSLFHVLIISIYLVIDFIVGKIEKKVKTNIISKLRNEYLHYRFLISVYLAFSLQINYSIMLQAFNCCFETFYTGLNSVLSFIGIVIFYFQILQLLVIFHFFRVIKKFVKLQSKVQDKEAQEQNNLDQLKKKYLPLFDELKTNQLSALVFYPQFLLRRFLLALVLIGLRGDPIVQVIFIVLINLIQAVYTVITQPFTKRIINITHIILEVWFITLNAFNFYFYTFDDEAKLRNLESINSDKAKLVGFIVVSMSNFVTFFGIIICIISLIKDVINQAKTKKQEQNKKSDTAKKRKVLPTVENNQIFSIQDKTAIFNMKESNSTLRESQFQGDNEEQQVEEYVTVSALIIQNRQ